MKLSVIQLTHLVALLWSVAVLMWLRPLPRLMPPHYRAVPWWLWVPAKPKQARLLKHQTFWHKRKQKYYRIKSWA